MRRFLMTTLSPLGRAPRWQFWILFVFNVVIGAVWTGLQSAFADGDPRATNILDHMGQNYIAYSVAYMTLVFMILMVMINRYHDLGRSGWGLLWLTLPLAVIAAALTIASPNVAYWLGIEATAAKNASKVLWLMSWPLAVFLSLLIHLRCLFSPGEARANRFGPPPQGSSAA